MSQRKLSLGAKIAIFFCLLILLSVVMSEDETATPARSEQSVAPANASDGGAASNNAPAPETDWRVNEGTSAMDDSPTVVLSLDAIASFSAWPRKELTPTLIIRCQEKRTQIYIVNGTSAAVEYEHSDAATVRFRLDEGAAFSQVWSESTDGDALFAPNAITLARRLVKATELTYQFTPFNSNPATSTFNLYGLDAVLPKVAAACGWKI